MTVVAPCFFVSDLHGSRLRYDALFAAVMRELPAALFLGGDLLPAAYGPSAAGEGPQGEFLLRVFDGP